MYFDPDWIFKQKPEDRYPNITGLMDDKPKPPKKKKAEVVSSMADVFTRPEPIGKMQPAQAQIPTVLQSAPDYMDKLESRGSTLDMQRNEFEQAFRDRIGRNEKWLLHDRPGLAANPAHQQNYYGRVSNREYSDPVITISDPKYNIRNNLNVPVKVIDELKKYAQAGQLTPEQTLLLAAISSNESEFGTTRDLFGINSLYQDFPGGIRQLPGSYEANELYKRYSGDPYKDVIGWLQRKTDNFADIERMNPGFQGDKNVNPRGEKYTDRIMRNAEILMSNPEFLQALFDGQVPQLNFTQQN